MLIATLAASKNTSKEINLQLSQASETKAKIETACEGYRPIARRGAVLYFVVADFGGVDPMYQVGPTPVYLIAPFTLHPKPQTLCIRLVPHLCI